jgi:hypothetical protein
MALIGMRIARVRKIHARYTGKRAEVVVESVIFFGDDDDVFDGKHDQLRARSRALKKVGNDSARIRDFA